jgi:hypothetical protein
MAGGVRHVRREGTVFQRETGQRAEAGGVSDTLALTATVGIRAHER